jgi:mono/diheme cytochrome c family protein
MIAGCVVRSTSVLAEGAVSMLIRLLVPTAVCGVAVFVAAGCAEGVDQARVDRVLALDGTADDGAAVYERVCQRCHDADGNGTDEPMSTLVPAQNDEELAATVAGGVHVETSAMSEQEAADLIAYLRETWPG